MLCVRARQICTVLWWEMPTPAVGVPGATGSCGGGGTHPPLSTAFQLQLFCLPDQAKQQDRDLLASKLGTPGPPGKELCPVLRARQRSHWGQCDERARAGILSRTGLKCAPCVSKRLLRLLLLGLLGLRVEWSMFLLSWEIWPYERHSANGTFAKWCVVSAHQPLSQLGLLGVHCVTPKCLNSEEVCWRDFQGPWQNQAAARWDSLRALCRLEAGTVPRSALSTVPVLPISQAVAVAHPAGWTAWPVQIFQSWNSHSYPKYRVSGTILVRGPL